MVIWYDNVIHWTDVERIYDFQIVLYKTGKIIVNYRSMQDDANSGTIGIKSPIGEYLLEVIYNSAFVSDELSVAFNTASWLSLDFISGDQYQIPYGSSSIYRINANTYNMSEGTYLGYIINDTNSSSSSDILPIILNTQAEFLLGDINQDNIINVLDVVRMVSIIMEEYQPSSLEYLLGDLNEDGVINVQDVVLIVNIILTN